MNKFTKQVYTDDKYHLGDPKWKFFAYTKLGKWLCEVTYKISKKYPNRVFLAEIHMFCLPF